MGILSRVFYKLTPTFYREYDKMSNMNYKVDFPTWLQNRMDERGWSQSDMAREANIKRQVIWNYLNKSIKKFDEEKLSAIAKASVRQIFTRIAKNANVPNVHPHKFRHTFAIAYLRNHGDVFTLKRLLGHATLDMTQRYLDIVKEDIADAHKHASPADNWRL